MANPHYPITVAPGVSVDCDSGAFQERDMLRRLTPSEALGRQLDFMTSSTAEGVKRFPDGFRSIVTYDMLVGVDEALVQRGGETKRVKKRGTEESASVAVGETIASAVYYQSQVHRIGNAAIAYSAQGATLRQYMGCVRKLIPLMRPSIDFLAMGGFCIIGMQTSLKPLFVEACRDIAPLLAAAGIHRAHVLGVCAHDVIAIAAAIFRSAGVWLTTDSSSIEVNSIMGKVWCASNISRGRGNSSPWRKVYGRQDKRIGYHPADLSIDNIRRYSLWLSSQGGGPTASPRLTYQEILL